MLASTPWAGSPRQPWSFSFDPNGIPLTSPASESDVASSTSIPTMSQQPTPQQKFTDARMHEELEPRRMSHGAVEINLPLASKPELLNDYISTTGGVSRQLL